MQTLKALILSGGGGRGAFHAGVYKYLMEVGKTKVEAGHAGVWDPQVVVGTSIGAVNGAAIAQGMTPAELEKFWIALQEKDVEGLPPSMRWLGRGIFKRLFHGLIGANLPQVPPEVSVTTPPSKFWPPLPLVANWLDKWTLGRWINLLDTGPLRRTLTKTMGFDAEKVAASPRTLLIAATNVQTGERVMFSNRDIYQRGTSQPRPDIFKGIDVNRIVASCSIPLVYPWTYDRDTQAHYWDGAVVANTPLGAAFDAFGDAPAEIPAEVVVVLMTPWRTAEDVAQKKKIRAMPASFDEAITYALDWMLLSSFRERLKLVEAFNQQAEREGSGSKYRKVKVVIVAPPDFMPAQRIIDYDEAESRKFIEMGYTAAREAFQAAFKAPSAAN